MRIRSQMCVLAAGVIFAISEARAANITANGDCNIIVDTMINSQLVIQGDCTVLRGGAPDRPNPNIQDGQQCRCTTRKSFVRRLEAEIGRMCRGICELPGYAHAYDMLNRIVEQVPACCYAAILNDVTRADKVSCKVKLVSSTWLDMPGEDREEIISSAAQKFRENKLDVCNLISPDR